MGLRDLLSRITTPATDEETILDKKLLTRKLAVETINESGRYQYLQKKMREAREEADRLFNAGVSAIERSRPTDAIRDMKRILELKTDDPPFEALASAYIGLAYYLEGDRNEAIRYLKKAMDDDPNNFVAPIFLSRVTETLEDAKNCVREAAMRSPQLRKNIAENYVKFFNIGKVSSNDWARGEYMSRYVKMFEQD